MAEKTADSEVADIPNHEKQLPVPIKKTPLRDLHNESNIIAQKTQSNNPISLKEPLISEGTKISGTKRPVPESQMTHHHQHGPTTSGTNSHLVYVRRKVESETNKANQSQDGQQQPKQSSSESGKAIPTSTVMSVTASKPVSVSEDLNVKPVSDEPKLTSPSQPQVKKNDWEERYVRLQMYLKALDQSSLDDHLQMLRSLSASELNRHAIELEMRAIQLSLEQGRELQRVKALNVLGKQSKATNTGPPAL